MFMTAAERESPPSPARADIGRSPFVRLRELAATHGDLAKRLELDVKSPAMCAGYSAADAAGDPLGALPVGGIVVG